MMAELLVFLEIARKAERRFFRQLPQYLFNGGLTGHNIAEHLTALLEDLGPTFVKIGQILSSRPDLVPEPFLSSLERLQDAVLPFRAHVAEEVIAQELHKKALPLLKHFDPMPLASGAFAQVHKSILPDGTPVAIKIQRPHLEKTTENELRFLEKIAHLADRFVTRQRIIAFSKLLEKLREGLYLHLDFSVEARNARRFSRNFSTFPGILFPKIYSAYSTKKVLTMSYFDGIKISRFYEIQADPEILTRKGFESLLKMLLLDGFVHADMHPANIFVLSDNNLAYIDLGLVAKLNRSMRQNLFKLIFAIATHNLDTTLKILFSMLERQKNVSFSEFDQKLRPLIKKYLSISLEELNLSDLLTTFFQNLYRLQLAFPTDYTLAFMSLVAVEGIAKKLSPQFRPFDYAREFILSQPALAKQVEAHFFS